MRRIRRKRLSQILTTLLGIALVLFAWWYEQHWFEPGLNTPYQDQLAPGIYRVTRVVDGDTLLLEYERTRLRLQGIDAPETVKEGTPVQPWGPEASNYTKRFVREAGDLVRIEIDGQPLDRHGRQLGFVWFEGRLLNEELVRAGLARAKLAYNYSDEKKARLRRAEEAARREKLGVWGLRSGQ